MVNCNHTNNKGALNLFNLINKYGVNILEMLGLATVVNTNNNLIKSQNGINQIIFILSNYSAQLHDIQSKPPQAQGAVRKYF
jgi:hypothetical protein